MTLIQIANDLLIAAELIQSGYYVGVETSQPANLLGATTVKVTGVVQEGGPVADAVCRLYIQASNDLIQWTTRHSQDLPAAPDVPSAFESPVGGGLAVPFAYVRARWVLRTTVFPLEGCPSMISPNSYYVITAHLHTSR